MRRRLGTSRKSFEQKSEQEQDNRRKENFRDDREDAKAAFRVVTGALPGPRDRAAHGTHLSSTCKGLDALSPRQVGKPL